MIRDSSIIRVLSKTIFNDDVQLKNKRLLEESDIRSLLYKLALSILLIFLIAEASLVNVQAQKEAKITGIVVDENGSPISGANVTIFSFDHRIEFKKRVTTDAAGRFYASVNKRGTYLVYITYDKKETPGVDYIPERWRTWVSLGSESSRKFILKKGASIYLDGEIRYVKTNRPANRYQFIVLGLQGGEDQWTGPVGDYGSFSHLVQFLGFDERLVVVPAETKVKIRVNAFFPANIFHSFILKGETGYFKIPQGMILHVDVREQNILSNINYVKGILDSSLPLLDDCLTAGFLVEIEKQDILNSYKAVEEALSLLKKGFFDQSFAKLRSAYILATRTESTLRGILQSSSQSIFPALFLFLFISSASLRLIMERSAYLEMGVGDEKYSISMSSLLDAAFYFLLVTLFYFIFPGCRLVSQSTYIIMSIFAFLVGKAVMLLFPKLAQERKGERRALQLKGAIVMAFSMACRNLRRRKMRSLINLINIMILVFGFITLTSISPGYGLLTKELKPALPIDALLIRDIPEGELPGAFTALPDSLIEWLESRPNVTLVSPKAENSMVDINHPLGRLYSTSGKWMDVLGILGIIPSKEANITGLNSVVNKGDYLEDGDLEGILISSSLQEYLDVDVGDKLYGFGKVFIIRGFFDDEAISKIIDVDGQTFLPYCKIEDPDAPPVSVACKGDSLIILNYETALTLPKVSISRVVVQLSDIEAYESFAKMVAITYEYRVYISHPNSLTLQFLREYTKGRGVEFVPFLMSLVMLNIAVSMFATVDERRNEIVTLSSVGLNPTHIAVLFIAEALVIGFIGGGFGYLLGISGYRLASLVGGLKVQEKVSAEWGLLSILLSGLTAVIASLIPALRSSTLVTPSLVRRWKMSSGERVTIDEAWVLDLPIKLMSREIEPFTAFIVRRLREDEGAGMNIISRVKFEKNPSDKGIVRKISFEYSFPQKGWTQNEIVIQPGEEKKYDLKLLSTFHGLSTNPIDAIHMTATYVRKLILEYSAATCEIVTLIDPYLSQFYNLVNAYNPTTLYIISPSTYTNTDERIETFKEALILRGIRPPMFVVSRVNPQNLEQTMKAVNDLVSRADIVCVSGENATLCTALAIEAVRQKKIICYVVDDRPVEERMKNPFKDLKILSLF